MSNLSYAESLKNEGNYIQSIAEFKKILTKSSDIREKANINQKIDTAQSYYNSSINVSIGEAFFPVVNLASNRGIVLTGKVSRSEETNLSEDLKERWEKIKKITVNFLDKYLDKNIKTVMVLDWGLDKYNFSVKPIPNSTIKINELVDGGSVELAMFISLVSIIINQNIGNSFAFTGEVDEDFSVCDIKGIKEKTEALKFERPLIKKLIFQPVNKKKTSIQKELRLAEVVKIIFPAFDKFLKELKEIYLERRLLTFNSLFVKVGKENIEYADFKFGDRDNIKEDEGEKVYSFLYNNCEKYKNSNNGLIISGLTISYSAPMFVIPLYNRARFLAIRYMTPSNKKDNEGAAYIVLSNDNKKYKPGEMIRFKLP